MSIRDFKTAAEYFFDTMATFTSTELVDYRTFVKYAVFSCLVAMVRSDVKEKVSWLIMSIMLGWEWSYSSLAQWGGG